MRWPRHARRGEINYAVLDRFTAAHFLIGAGYGLVDLELWIVVALATGWEVVEDLLKALVPKLFPHATRDTLRNAAGDVMAVLGGWAVTCLLLRA